jgi:hypothetical protein
MVRPERRVLLASESLVRVSAGAPGSRPQIVRGLKAEPPQNDAEWQAQADLVQGCLAEMVEMSEPTVNQSMGATSRYVHRRLRIS